MTTEDDLISRKDALIAQIRRNEDKGRAYIRDIQDATIQRDRDLDTVHEDYCAGLCDFDQRSERVEIIWARFDAEKAQLEGALNE